MQCGTAAFSIAEYERETEVEVPLDFPFAHEGYVVVAMTDQSGCWSVLRERRAASFTLVVQRDGTVGSRVEGTVFWIGMGHHRPIDEVLQPEETEPVSSTEEDEQEQDVLLFNGGATEAAEDISSDEAVSTIQSIDPTGEAEEKD
jgi:hypothetical protein